MKKNQELTQEQITVIKSVITAALHNSEVIRNQVNSLRDDYPLLNIEGHLNKATELLAETLEELNAKE